MQRIFCEDDADHTKQNACQGCCLPLHDEERVGHVVLFTLGLVYFFRQHISHRALQKVGHFHVPVPIEHAIQSFASATEAVYREGCDTQSVEKN